MARMEIDSFILKFKSLLLSGRNASLVIKSNAGKAEVNLNVELEDVSPHPANQHQHHHGPRNGPSRERRRLRRAAAAAAAQAAAQGAENVESIVEEVTTAMVVAEAAEVINPVKDTTVEPETLKDEFCSNQSFEIESDEQLVEKILVTADCQADWSDKVVTKLMDEKLNTIGIKMKSIKVNRNIRKCFESCLVSIYPMQRKLIEKESFPLRRWTMKCIM